MSDRYPACLPFIIELRQVDRQILHVDMDAFYASVEVRDRPELRGQPVVVGGNPERRGVVSAANYAARRYGIHSAMPTRTAARLCPHAVFLPVRMHHYAAVSRQLGDILRRYTPLVEPLGLDEAFLDVTASQRLYGPAPQIGRRIRDELRSELGLVASVGVAPNKFLAKLASDIEKPDGFVVVEPEAVLDFLAPLPVTRLWGVGKACEQRLHALGIQRVGDLHGRPVAWTVQHLGKLGKQLWELALGIDERPVVADRAAKSISHETTFSQDVADHDRLIATLSTLTDRVAHRLRNKDLYAGTIQVKVRFADFATVTRAKRLAVPCRGTREIWRAGRALFVEARRVRSQSVRLLGIGVTDLIRASSQRELFDSDPDQGEDRVDDLTDRLVERFGERALHRGSSR